MGRPPIGKTAMTGAERVRRYRLKHGTDKPVTKPAGPDHAALVKELARLLAENAALRQALAAAGHAAGEDRRQRNKPRPRHTLADNEKCAPCGKLDWYKPNAKWHRQRAQAMVPRSPSSPTEYEQISKDGAGNVTVSVVGNDHEADVLEYEIHTKRKNGRFPVMYRSLTGYCSGLLNESGRPMTWDEDSDAATVEEAKARAQAHFERRLAGIEVASPEDECAVSAPVPSG